MPGSRKRKGESQPGASKKQKKRVRQRRNPVLCDCGCGQTVSPSTRSNHRREQGLVPAPAPVLNIAPAPVPVAAVAVPPLAFDDDYADEVPDLVSSDDEHEPQEDNAIAQQHGRRGHDASCQHGDQNFGKRVVVRSAAQKYIHVLLQEQIRSGDSQESVVNAAKVNRAA